MTRGKTNNQPAKAHTTTKNGKTADKQMTKTQVDLGSLLPAPSDLVRRFREEVDHLIEEFGLDNLTGSLPGGESLGLHMWAPQVEAFDRAGEFVVRADLPGLSKDDISIDLSDSAITIHGHRKQKQEETKNGYNRSERSYGSFRRSITLPQGVDADTAEANFRDGVLEITMAAPEIKERQARKLEIGGRTKAKAVGR